LLDRRGGTPGNVAAASAAEPSVLDALLACRLLATVHAISQSPSIDSVTRAIGIQAQQQQQQQQQTMLRLHQSSFLGNAAGNAAVAVAGLPSLSANN
jgi:hypothetical protein